MTEDTLALVNKRGKFIGIMKKIISGGISSFTNRSISNNLIEGLKEGVKAAFDAWKNNDR